MTDKEFLNHFIVTDFAEFIKENGNVYSEPMLKYLIDELITKSTPDMMPYFRYSELEYFPELAELFKKGDIPL